MFNVTRFLADVRTAYNEKGLKPGRSFDGLWGTANPVGAAASLYGTGAAIEICRIIYEGTDADYEAVLAGYQGTGDDPLGLQLRNEFPPDEDE